MSPLQKLRNCYDALLKEVAPRSLESYQVAESVEELRCYWRPTKVITLLFAESHVLTSGEDFRIRVEHPSIPKDMCDSFVRFVYCLGYGERELAPGISKNAGTSQYWKLLHACQNRGSVNDLLRSKSHLERRITAKIELLERLRDAGIWLVDASITACYLGGKDGRLPSRDVARILKSCWDHYIGDIVRSADPNGIIVVGKGVEATLQQQLDDTGIPRMAISQPQARLAKVDRLKEFRALSIYCQKHAQ